MRINILNCQPETILSPTNTLDYDLICKSSVTAQNLQAIYNNFHLNFNKSFPRDEMFYLFNAVALVKPSVCEDIM